METYEEWDMTLPVIPARNRLYHLEPIGVGTPYVESLTSYVARLAERHSVTPKALIIGVILPLQGKVDRSRHYYYRLNTFWNTNSSTLNGTSPTANEWVETLHALTGVPQLRFLTMLTFREVIALNKLLRRWKAWCPQCLDHWHHHRQVVYEPLAWSLNGVDICIDHRQPLTTHCPQCSKTIPLLTQTMRPGYCPYCTAFLGNPQRLEDRDERVDMEWQSWKAKVTGDLLVAAPHFPELPSREHFARRFEAFVESYAAGNLSALARLLGVTTQALWEYLHQGCVPFFETFLTMCHAFSLTPVEFLITTLLPPLAQEKPHFSPKSIPMISKGKNKSITEEDIQRMRQVLEAVLAIEYQADHIPTLKEIALCMGYQPETVQKHCPDLSQAIVRRHRRYWAEEGNRTRVKQALEMSLAQSVPEPLSEVARRLRCDAMILRKHCPDLSRAIVTRYRNRYDLERIEQRLQEALTSQEETPSLVALARELGCGPSTLSHQFPDLCRQISTQRYIERKRRHQERVAAGGEKIRQAVSHLHEQQVYPTARRVMELIGDPHLLREEEFRKIWWLTLQELGYPTKTERSDQ